MCLLYNDIMYKTKHFNEHWKASKAVNLEVTVRDRENLSPISLH